MVVWFSPIKKKEGRDNPDELTQHFSVSHPKFIQENQDATGLATGTRVSTDPKNGEQKYHKYATQLDLLKITTTNHDPQLPNLLVIQSDTISDKNV